MGSVIAQSPQFNPQNCCSLVLRPFLPFTCKKQSRNQTEIFVACCFSRPLFLCWPLPSSTYACWCVVNMAYGRSYMRMNIHLIAVIWCMQLFHVHCLQLSIRQNVLRLILQWMNTAFKLKSLATNCGTYSKEFPLKYHSSIQAFQF